MTVALIPEEEPLSRLQYPQAEVVIMLVVKPGSLLYWGQGNHAPVPAFPDERVKSERG
jgi:hypothetical protein